MVSLLALTLISFHFYDNQGTFVVALSRNIALMAGLVRASATPESQYASGLISVTISVDGDVDNPIYSF